VRSPFCGIISVCGTPFRMTLTMSSSFFTRVHTSSKSVGARPAAESVP
jgi:hypothetical protein